MINAKKPTPVQLKILAGNPGKRPLNTDVPQPTPGIGACPDWFPAEAMEEWQRVVPELAALGVLTRVDRAVLEAHCLAYAEMIITAKTGGMIKASLLGQLRILAAELGLTPSARARMTTPKGESDDPAEAFFN